MSYKHPSCETIIGCIIVTIITTNTLKILILNKTIAIYYAKEPLKYL